MSFLKILSILPLRFRFFRYLEKVSSIYQGKGWDSGTVTSEINACLSLLQIKPKIFIDIGANKGVYSRYILKKFDDIECHLFEPSKYNYSILKELFSTFKKVKINKIALSNHNDSNAKLFSDKAGSALSSLTKRRLEHLNINMKIEEKIEIKRFDDYWKSNNSLIDFVKIDVEGHELDVLEGFGDLIKKTRIIQFEFGGTNIDTKTFFQDFWYFFKGKDFSIYRITPIGILKIKKYSDQDEIFSFTNYIAVNNKL